MRALIIVLDSVGVGHAPDAASYGDEGANTLGHIFETVPGLELPNLKKLGLGQILNGRATLRGAATPARQNLALPGQLRASFGRMQERSAGKDTTTGHWEIAGVILEQPFATFESFPDALVRDIEREAKVTFIGNYARSGTTILEELGVEHVRTGNPILYTSADSVLQIAAHEKAIAVSGLYDICQIARKHADEFRIGRVIARPFDGEPGRFRRTARRHDYSMKPPRTVLNALSEARIDVIGVGKIDDIFDGEGITESFPTATNAEGTERILQLLRERESGLIFANLVDFDMQFGHRRDPAGYAAALSEFDTALAELLPLIRPEDLVVITADHGNDPTFRGTDHTREQVPLFVLHNGESRDLGTRDTFADVAATLAEFFGLPEPWSKGSSFMSAKTEVAR